MKAGIAEAAKLSAGSGEFDLGLSLTKDYLRGEAVYKHKLDDTWYLYGEGFGQYTRNQTLDWGAGAGVGARW